MYVKRLAATLLPALIACGGGSTAPEVDNPNISPPQPGFEGKAFTLASLRTQREQQNTAFLEFLSESSFRMGLYHVPIGPGDNQGSHGEDEIKYVVSGSAKFSVNGIDHDAEPGSAFFVKAQTSHRFHSVTSDLDILVVFARAATGPNDPLFLAYPMSQMVAARDPSANVWDPFLSTQTMTLGMYMLPSSVGGDGTISHTFDEISIVVNGRGRFVVGPNAIDIEPGTVVFVQQGLGHSYNNLTEDLDVLLLWER